MGDVGSELADFIGSVLPNSSSKDLILETLQSLGVETLEGLKYVQEPDLVNILRPIEARKFIGRINAL
ncbi:Interferon-induced 44, partial [Clarias magur]